MLEEAEKRKVKKPLKKITKQRLKNIALYYLKRFESSEANLRRVLLKRINDYAYQNPEFVKADAYEWVDELLDDFKRFKYIDDIRFAELKIRDYLAAGKAERYIKGKLAEKGISEVLADQILAQQEFSPFENAMRLAKKKHIGPYRIDEEQRREYRQKDMGTLIRAGFDYDVAVEVLNTSLD
ncbi:MAG: regulatory protein RecX [Alphaproteobacteria bacterium]|nr:regulatory protein RecX [Alphaproteobacteria bacterium]